MQIQAACSWQRSKAKAGRGETALKNPSLLDALARAQSATRDEERPAAVAKQAARGRWTARAGAEALCDPDSFVEYGGLARPITASTEGPADGLIMGIGLVAGAPVSMVLYDYTVFGGSQSYVNHAKIDRMYRHAGRLNLPVISWLDGGGARPQDATPDRRMVISTFVTFARLSGKVPTVGIVPSRAFAGHANLAGMSDCLIAVKGAAIGLAGPPLVEAALGVKLTPEEIGSAATHFESGVVDLLVADEQDAVDAARKYLGYFVGDAPEVETPDTKVLRTIVPENPRRAYDVRRVIEHIADLGSIMELRSGFGKALVTAFVRIGGRTIGVIASQPMHLAGAIDTPAADKGARFGQICDAFDIPILLLCDTPGLMVGPDAERSGLVRHSARLLTALANATVPLMTVVLRKAYGLGFYILGSLPLEPAILLAWPTAEYGGMAADGAVNIIHRDELEAIADAKARDERRAELSAAIRRSNTAIETAARYYYDDVIDPADTRKILLRTIETLPKPPRREARKRIIEPF